MSDLSVKDITLIAGGIYLSVFTAITLLGLAITLTTQSHR